VIQARTHSLHGVSRGLIALVLIFCSLHGLLPSCSAQQSERLVSAVNVVIFDNSREQFWSPFDAGFFGYSELAVSLRKAGYLVTESDFPVTISLRTLNPHGSVLVMGPATGQWYSQKEIDAIVEYVKKGGGLLILAEADASGGNNFQNPLSTQFGILVNSVSVVDTANSIGGTAGQWIFARSDFFGIDRVGLPVTGFVMAGGSAFPVLTPAETAAPRGAVIGAAASHGEGRVVCIADSQFLINGGKKEIGIGCAQNRAFALAVFDWLAGRERPIETRIVPQFTMMTGYTLNPKIRVEGTTNISTRIQGGTITPEIVKKASGEYTFDIDLQRDGFVEFIGSDGSRRTIVLLTPPRGGIGARLIFDMRGYGPDMGDPVNGLSEFAGLLRDKGYWVWGVDEGLINVAGLHGVIVVNPLRTEGRIFTGDMDAEGLRWLILAEPFSSIGIQNRFGEWFRNRGFSDRKVAAAEFAKRFGVNCLPYVVFETDSSRIIGRHPTFPILDYGIEECHGFRCGILETEGGRPVLVASEAAWGVEGGLGLRFGPHSMEPGPGDYRKQPVVGVLRDNAVVVADLNVFFSQHMRNRGNWALGLALADWIAGLDFKVPEL